MCKPTPPTLLFTPQAIIVFDSVDYQPITGPAYPEWAEALGWLTVAFIMMWTPVWFIGSYCYKGGFKVRENITS